MAAATGSRFAPFAALRFRALQGREADASALIANAIEQAAAGGQGMAATQAYWAAAVLYNGLGRYEEAASAPRQASSEPSSRGSACGRWSSWSRRRRAVGKPGSHVMRWSSWPRRPQPSGTDWALGVEARCRALLSHGAAGDELYREAIDRLGCTRLRPELARAHLLYGEWQLRTAYDLFAAIGMEAFAERARRELLATGEKARKRSPQTREELTAQEEQVARLACDGLSNPEIGAQLFISARTVQHHLAKVFAKLGISSRSQLRGVLPRGPVAAGPL